MAERPAELLDDLVLAHRVLVAQNVLDAFGHVSVRDPERPDVFWLAGAGPPSRVAAGDFLAHGLDGEPLRPSLRPLFSERFIHAAIFAARADVGAICHHHAPSVMPFCIGRGSLRPVSQTGAFLGGPVPLWDSADGFGETAMLVDTMAQARSLADALGRGSMVLMRGHGASVAAGTLRELVFKAVFACREADILRAVPGEARQLSPGEIARAGTPGAAIVDRCWSHWTALLAPPETQSE
jgi:ribulose-5-phosphate 4-epimerase/fuculose-1-phosphate aldolase